jgi:hypothetical protein
MMAEKEWGGVGWICHNLLREKNSVGFVTTSNVSNLGIQDIAIRIIPACKKIMQQMRGPNIELYTIHVINIGSPCQKLVPHCSSGISIHHSYVYSFPTRGEQLYHFDKALSFLILMHQSEGSVISSIPDHSSVCSSLPPRGPNVCLYNLPAGSSRTKKEYYVIASTERLCDSPIDKV